MVKRYLSLLLVLSLLVLCFLVSHPQSKIIQASKVPNNLVKQGVKPIPKPLAPVIPEFTIPAKVYQNPELVLTPIKTLSHEHLKYIYGSDDIHTGGLDCSGFTREIYNKAYGIVLPNEADKQFDLIKKNGIIWDKNSRWSASDLKPGDFIFFAGPRNIPRESEISHVMIYCGGNRMAGAQLPGVGYYYFKPTSPEGYYGESGSRFVGKFAVFAYGRFEKTQIANKSTIPEAPSIKQDSKKTNQG